MKLRKNMEEIIKEISDNSKIKISDEVISDTPKRMEEFYKEIFSGLNEDPYEYLKDTFLVTQDENKENDIIIEKDISFHSMCEHHFLPFYGKIFVGYIPNKKIIGFSSIIKVIEILSKRPQLQEKLANELSDILYKGLECKGIYILIEAEHLCMTIRGVKATGSKIITTTSRGLFSENENLKQNFISLVKG